MKRIATIREKSTDQLKERLREIAISLMRVSQKTGQGMPRSRTGKTIDNMYPRRLKRERARINTILGERERRLS